MINFLVNETDKNCIIFVHGFLGSVKSWDKFKKYLKKKYQEPYGYQLHSYTYYEENAGFIKKLFGKRNTSNTEELLKYYQNLSMQDYNVFIVGHSMGGLIAKKFLILLHQKNIDFSNIKGLATYATPHNGHKFSYTYYFNYSVKWLSWSSERLIKYRILPQIGDLYKQSEFIKEINSYCSTYNIFNNIEYIKVCAKKDLWVSYISAGDIISTKYDDLGLKQNDMIYMFDSLSHTNLISPKEDDENFAPIDLLIDSLKKFNDINSTPKNELLDEVHSEEIFNDAFDVNLEDEEDEIYN